MSVFLTESDKAKLLSEVMDPSRVVLTCPTHNWVYGTKRPPNYKCRQCWMASFMGLLSNTPPNRRLEVLEMLEYSVHKLVEADKKGQIDRIALFKHPEVSINKE